MARQKQVGEVKLKYLSGSTDREYSDGAVEDLLLELFKSDTVNDEQRRKLVGANWAFAYHLSPLRQNLLGWYGFKPGARVLEIGAGCGAITEGLVKKDVRLTALDLSKRRSLINAYRNKARSNLEIVVGNLQDLKSAKPYDYVICVGVLEYAGSFISGDEPYLDFIKSMRGLTGSKGKLLLAIENRLGLKYFAGAQEDHADNTYFDGLNGYPGQKGVQTFGRQELARLLTGGGYDNSYFYYPFPDYKMPRAVFSDDYLPGRDCDFPLGLLPAPAPDKPRRQLFSEQSAMMYLESNGLAGELANSFLVEAD